MSTRVATLIGDLVESRLSTGRRALHQDLRDALTTADEQAPGPRPAWITAGDEFQGVYSRVGTALDAALWIRLQLHPAQVRFGIGWGQVTVLDDDGIQDGPGWWAARAAIESVEQQAAQASLRMVRTAFHLAKADPGTAGSPVADAASVNAALLCRDHLLGSADDRDIAILKGLLMGTSQSDLARAEGISVSAVSQRVRRSGLAVLVRTHELLRGL